MGRKHTQVLREVCFGPLNFRNFSLFCNRKLLCYLPPRIYIFYTWLCGLALRSRLNRPEVALMGSQLVWPLRPPIIKSPSWCNKFFMVLKKNTLQLINLCLVGTVISKNILSEYQWLNGCCTLFFVGFFKRWSLNLTWFFATK